MAQWPPTDHQDFNNPFSQYLGFGAGAGGAGLPGGIGGPNRAGNFDEHYRCYSVAMMQGNERENVNYGGKIILPPSALAKLSSLHIMYPMLFTITNEQTSRKTSAGVLEFIAEEGRAYLPHWMMTTLGLDQGQFVRIVNTSLPTGHFVKIQPQSVDFLDITDPKAVLENAMRNFSTLTQGDIIEFLYNTKIYRILVMEIKPSGSGSISIVETDLEVDFAPPVGYEEPKPVPRRTNSDPPQHLYSGGEPIKEEERGWRSFRGAGSRLNGKEAPEAIPLPVGAVAPVGPANMFTAADLDKQRTAPAALNMPFGKLFFGYKIVPLKSAEQVAQEKNGKQGDDKGTNAFEGQGQTLRTRRAQSGKARAGGPSSAPPPTSSAPAASGSAQAPSEPQASASAAPQPFGGKGHTLK